MMRLERSAVWVSIATWACAAAALTAISAVALVVPSEVPDAPPLGGTRWLAGLVLLAVQAGLLWSRHSHPRQALLAVSLIAPVGAALGLGAAIGSTTVAVMVAAFRAVTGRGSVALRGTVPALGAAALLVAAGELLARVSSGSSVAAALGPAVAQGTATLGLVTLVALVVSWRREARSALEERATARAGEQAARVEAAVTRERSAMARELHDIAAHHLTGIAVMSAALGRQIDSDPEGAKRAVAQVREQTTAMLEDMRALVGLLRRHDGPGAAQDARPREESLAGITALVESATARGEMVSIEVVEPQGVDPRLSVGPLAQLSAYRTAQEALTNAARHAAGQPCVVRVDASSPEQVVLTVRNRTAATASATEVGGFGLIGMRERAELTGARLTAGPVGESWLVSLDLPVRQHATLIEEPG